MTNITEYLEILLKSDDLSLEQAKALFDTILDGEVPEPQIAAFLTAMRIKGTSVPELAGLASSLRGHAVRVETGLDNLIDTCGTGGARVKTFNISTTAAFVAAGAGAYVAKHGNRGITSKCGSADVLTELGVNIDPGPEKVAKCITDVHIGFIFAPKFHPAMRYVQPTRKALGFRTAFNILGPLVNPAGATAQVIGVADESLMQKIAETLKMLGTSRAMVVHSDGLDEISTIAKTKILELKDGQITSKELDPADFGIAAATLEDLKGDDVQTNAKITENILCGKETGPRRDIIILNAAAAIIVANLTDNFESAIGLANKSINDGKALEALKKLIEISN